MKKKARTQKKGSQAAFKGQKKLFKFMALLFSATIWFYVLNSEPYEVEKELPIGFITPVGQAVANLTPPTVKVRLKGSRAFMQNIFSGSEKMILNLRESQYLGLDEFEAIVNDADIPLPFGVEVLEVEPRLIPIRLEREIKKEVKVRPQFVGELPSELRLIEQKISPKTVMVKGPIDVMRRVRQLQTRPINRASLEGSGDMELPIHELDPRVQVEGLPDENVVFSYSVKARSANVTLKNVKIRFLASSHSFTTEDKAAALDVLAPEGRSLKASEVQVIADIPEDQEGGEVRVKLRAELPEGVHLLQIHPEEIIVKLQ